MTKFDDSISVNLLKKMRSAIDEAAAKALTSVSTYARQALMRALKDDGFDIRAA